MLRLFQLCHQHPGASPHSPSCECASRGQLRFQAFPCAASFPSFVLVCVHLLVLPFLSIVVPSLRVDICSCCHCHRHRQTRLAGTYPSTISSFRPNRGCLFSACVRGLPKPFLFARYQSKSGKTSDRAYCCQTQSSNERTEKMSHSCVRCQSHSYFFPNKRPASNERDSLRTG